MGADVGIAQRIPVDLSERDRCAQRARGTRQPHGFERVAGRYRIAAAACLADAPRSEQRALYLHEMDIARMRDTGVLYRGSHASRNLIDLRQAAELPEGKRRCMRAADRERGALPAVAFHALEHDPMRCHGAFGAARHHKADLGGLLARKQTLEQQAEVRELQSRG